MADTLLNSKTNTEKEQQDVRTLDSLVKEEHTVFALRSCFASQYNGSFDNDNRPRYIGGTKIIMASPFSEKRKIRDFLELKGDKIFIKKGHRKEFLDAFIAEYFSNYTQKQLEEESVKKEIFKALIEYFEDLADFGLTLSVSKMNDSYTGPIQFNSTFSLNEVYTNESDASLTTCLREFKKKEHENDKEELKAGGGVGKFYTVIFALMAAYAKICPQMAEEYSLKYRHIKNFDKAAILAPSRMVSNSKSGITTELYFRVESKTKYFVLEDLRHDFKFISLKDPSQVLSYNDYEIDATEVIKRLKRHQKHLETFYIYDTERIKFFIKDDENKESKRMSFINIIKTYLPEVKIVEIDPYEEIDKGYYADGGNENEQ